MTLAIVLPSKNPAPCYLTPPEATAAFWSIVERIDLVNHAAQPAVPIFWARALGYDKEVN